MKWIIAIVGIVLILLFIWLQHSAYRRDVIYAGEVVLIGLLAASNYIRVKARKNNGNTLIKGNQT